MPTCPICKNYYIWENHTCPQKWQCCFDYDFSKDEVPDADYMRQSGRDIYAADAEKAAEKFAEQFSDFEDPEQMTIFVMDDKETTIWKYVVDREVVPTYDVAFNYKPEVYPCSPVGEEVEP